MGSVSCLQGLSPEVFVVSQKDNHTGHIVTCNSRGTVGSSFNLSSKIFITTITLEDSVRLDNVAHSTDHSRDT